MLVYVSPDMKIDFENELITKGARINVYKDLDLPLMATILTLLRQLDDKQKQLRIINYVKDTIEQE